VVEQELHFPVPVRLARLQFGEVSSIIGVAAPQFDKLFSKGRIIGERNDCDLD